MSSTFLATVYKNRRMNTPANETPPDKERRTPVSQVPEMNSSEAFRVGRGVSGRSKGWQTYRGLTAETTIAVDPNVY